MTFSDNIRSHLGFRTASSGIGALLVLASCLTLRAQSPGPESSGEIEQPRASPTLEEARAQGLAQSSYRKRTSAPSTSGEAPTADTKTFHAEIEPLLRKSCFECHGAKRQKGKFRVDTLDPDLINGDDADWWLEVLNALSNGEMPPEDDDVELADADRSRIIDWLSKEIQLASEVQRNEQGHSSFRRMTRYEYNYALQDLLGLPYDFAADLPPETVSEDGFENSSERLQMSLQQIQTYHDSSRKALLKATVRGERPSMLYYAIPMSADIKKRGSKESGRRRSGTRFEDLETGKTFAASFSYNGGRLAHLPSSEQPETPPVSSKVLILPAGGEHKIDLGDKLPDEGFLRVRIRACRASMEDPSPPALRLKFGNQPSNDSRISRRVDDRDVAILASPEKPQFYEWDIPLTEIPRNVYRGVTQRGDLPNPTEYLILENSSSNRRKGSQSEIRIDYVEISTPYYESWPPESHTRIFIDSENKGDENKYAQEILSSFLPRAWRREVSDSEIDRQLVLFAVMRPECRNFEEAIIELLATAIVSPRFLYLVQEDAKVAGAKNLQDHELATRLSMFLWCSLPDRELLDLASQGKLKDPKTLAQQTQRMLSDPRSRRFADHFVRQWLGMQLLDYLAVEKDSYPDFDEELKEAMQEEPIAVFLEMLKNDRSVLDFIHADYTLANERLARHYQLENVHGHQFQKVTLSSNDRRGGLLTQAGLLAMNSDGKDSHPLKRGIWLLERLLNDPPPPPPPVVPEIDLADPEIAKLTLKERIENHRDDPACMSCHAKIDPWGLAFENFDAVGAWRDEIDGTPVDATSRLFNHQKLDGMDGLKRFLMTNRQDQFCRAVVHKLSTFALGRPLSFADRSSIDRITSDLRKKGDGLATLVTLIVTSELFRAR